MATVDKSFRIKNGLVVEGSIATVNGSNIVTEASTEFLQDTVGAMVNGSTQTNITVTYDDVNGKLNFVAENGVADSTTDNLSEGSTNKYFTDERAQDAVAAALAAGTHTNISVSYDDVANSISLTGAVTYTDENAQDAVGNAVGNGLDYDDTTGAISVDPSEFTLDQIGSAQGDVSLGTKKITNLGTPTASTDAANKAYVDSVTEGLHIHASAVAATTTNISISADLEAGDILDGVTLVAGDRVLVKNQTVASENGIYVVQATGSAVRATDFDQPSEVDGGDFIFVTGGTVNDNTGWVQTATGVATIGTDPIYFTQFSGAGTYLAGNGLTLSGNSFSIDTSVTTANSATQTLTNKTINLGNNTVSGTIAQFNSAVSDADLATIAGTETLTNKTIDGASNTLTNIGNTSLSNSSVTVGSTNISLGGTSTTLAGLTSVSSTDFSGSSVSLTNAKINSATVIAATSGSATVIDSFAVASYTTAKYLIQMTNSTGDREATEVLITVDSSNNVYITEYANVITNVDLGSISATYSSGNVDVIVTPTANNITVKASRTLIAA